MLVKSFIEGSNDYLEKYRKREVQLHISTCEKGLKILDVTPLHEAATRATSNLVLKEMQYAEQAVGWPSPLYSVLGVTL